MMRGLKKHFHPAAVISLILAVFAVYWPSLQNGFVWDDTALVLRDPFIRSWRLIPEGFRHFLFTDATASNFYRPIQRLVFTLDYAVFDFRPWGYHLTSILLHAAAAVALFFCAEALIARTNKMDGRKGGLLAWLAAFAWAIHPVHTAAVCYVAGSADLLAALFGFLGLYFAAKSPREEKKTQLNDWLAALCFLLALLSKESGVTSLLIWLLAAGWLFGAARLRRWLGFAAVIVIIYCGLRFSAEKVEPPPQPEVPVAVRPILMARAWAEYTGLLIAPANLHMERNLVALNHDDMPKAMQEANRRAYQTLLGAALIAAFAVWWRWARRREPAAPFFMAAFLIAYIPISNFFPLNANAAEHWLYFNSAFLFVAAALSLEAAPFHNIILTWVAALWLGCLGARTLTRNYDWKDQRTFLMSTMASGGNSARMLINMGTLESSEGRQKIAIAYFQEALRLRPDQPFALLGLVSAYIRNHQYEPARKNLEKARIDPFIHAEALQDLAVLEYLESGTDRTDLLLKAAKLEPDNWSIQKRYIKHLIERQEYGEAVHALKSVLEQQPWRAETWEMLSAVLKKINQPDLATGAHEKAMQEDVHLKEDAWLMQLSK